MGTKAQTSKVCFFSIFHLFLLLCCTIISPQIIFCNLVKKHEMILFYIFIFPFLWFLFQWLFLIFKNVLSHISLHPLSYSFELLFISLLDFFILFFGFSSILFVLRHSIFHRSFLLIRLCSLFLSPSYTIISFGFRFY